MDNDSMKKAGVMAVVVLMTLYFVAIPVMWLVIGAPVWVCLAVAILSLIVVAVLMYHARGRIREIEEGLEDAVDNY